MDPNFNGFANNEIHNVDEREGEDEEELDLNDMFFNEFVPFLVDFAEDCFTIGTRMFMLGVTCLGSLMFAIFGAFVLSVTLPFFLPFLFIVVIPIWIGLGMVLAVVDIIYNLTKPFWILLCYRYLHVICRIYRIIDRVEDFLHFWLSETPRRIVFGAPTTVTFNEFNEDFL
eukprot:11850.XXX_862449_862961_1 [CDS] Oithona nana genome sequencing.